jgi:hypothetical protein
VNWQRETAVLNRINDHKLCCNSPEVTTLLRLMAVVDIGNFG